MKRVTITMMLAATLLFAGCYEEEVTYFEERINELEEEIDELEDNEIASIEKQIAAINGSIDNLKEVDKELDGYIKSLQNAAADLQSQLDATNQALAALESDLEGQISASEQKVLNELNTVKTALEGQLATINNTIATLQAKDAELDQKIADLRTYVDNTLANYATKDWANATFTTLEQYEEMQTAISEINALIKSTQESIAALEEKLNKKIADDIAAAVADVNSDIAAKVTEITNGYTTAIANATDAITEAYINAIKTAITDCENAMREWVNGVLADGYYQKAEIDGKITALQTLVAEGDAALQKEIDALEAALEKASSDLSAVYEKAIAEAVAGGGIISDAIADAVATAQDNLQAQIDAITGEIVKIKARLDIIEADIASINQQIIAINGSIDDLEKVDAELDGYIKSLQTTAADLQSQLDATNDALAALESDLEGQISASEQKVLNELNTVKTALEGQLATINNTIATLQAKDAELDQKIADLRTYVDNTLANYATKDWANATFTTLEQYEEIRADIAEVQQKLTALQSEMAAIKTAVTELQTRMAAVEKDVDSLQTAVADLESRIADLENNFANRIQSLTYIPTHTDGKATMAYNAASGKWEAELSFFVTPKSVVGNIKQEHLSAKGVYTAATRAVDLIDLSVTAFVGDADNGTITVTVSGDNLTNFLGGTSDAAVFLIISDGNSEFVSDYVPLALKNPGNINAANMSADDLKTTVSQALNDGIRNFTITSNLTEEQQKAVGTALCDWCGIAHGITYNEEGQGTVTLTLPDVTEVYSDTFGEIFVDEMNVFHPYALGALYLPNATKIGNQAFFHQEFLRIVHAPKVATVDESAFEHCNKLTTVEMPLLETVGSWAFSPTLISTIPGKPVTIEDRAFDSCNNLTEVNLTQATSIGSGAFGMCNNLQSVTASLLTEVPTWAFSNCKQLTSLTFAQPITLWGGQVLNNMNTENITLTLHPDQKVLTGGEADAQDSKWTPADGAATVEFGTGKTFCGYTFKEIKKYGE